VAAVVVEVVGREWELLSLFLQSWRRRRNLLVPISLAVASKTLVLQSLPLGVDNVVVLPSSEL